MLRLRMSEALPLLPSMNSCVNRDNFFIFKKGKKYKKFTLRNSRKEIQAIQFRNSRPARSNKVWKMPSPQIAAWCSMMKNYIKNYLKGFN